VDEASIPGAAAPGVSRGRRAAPADSGVGVAVAIGSTSVHFTAARVRGHRLEPVADESVLLGLGAVVDREGRLASAARDRLVTELQRYVARARELGARDLTFVGTEPLRRASDAGSVARSILAETGSALHVLSHEEEAFLSLLGATGGERPRGTLLLVDIGGGSTDYVRARADGAPAAGGVRLGAARLTDAVVRSDPPSRAEIDALLEHARVAVAGGPFQGVDELVLVGGTASNLARIVPVARRDRRLTPRRLRIAFARLAAAPAAAIAERYGIRTERARLLPGGAAIVEAVLERSGLPAARVSEAGLREGVILAVAHAGAGWRSQIRELTRGWGDDRPA